MHSFKDLSKTYYMPTTVRYWQTDTNNNLCLQGAYGICGRGREICT